MRMGFRSGRIGVGRRRAAQASTLLVASGHGRPVGILLLAPKLSGPRTLTLGAAWEKVPYGSEGPGLGGVKGAPPMAGKVVLLRRQEKLKQQWASRYSRRGKLHKVW